MAVLEARTRNGGRANTLRRQGWIPAVVYGPGIESQSIAVHYKRLEKLFSTITRSSRVDLTIDDGEETSTLNVFVKSIDYDAISDDPVHVDFYHPEGSKAIRLHVPIKAEGVPVGASAGGVLNVLYDQVEVEGLPQDIPDLIRLDVSQLEIGEAVRVGEIDFGDVSPLLPDTRTIVTVMAPRTEAEEEAIFAAIEEEAPEILEGEELAEGEELLEGEEEAPEEGEETPEEEGKEDVDPQPKDE